MFVKKMEVNEAIEWIEDQFEAVAESDIYELHLSENAGPGCDGNFRIDIEANRVSHAVFNLDHSRLIKKAKDFVKGREDSILVYDLERVERGKYGNEEDFKPPHEFAGIVGSEVVKMFWNRKSKRNEYPGTVQYFVANISVHRTSVGNGNLLFLHFKNKADAVKFKLQYADPSAEPITIEEFQKAVRDSV